MCIGLGDQHTVDEGLFGGGGAGGKAHAHQPPAAIRQRTRRIQIVAAASLRLRAPARTSCAAAAGQFQRPVGAAVEADHRLRLWCGRAQQGKERQPSDGARHCVVELLDGEMVVDAVEAQRWLAGNRPAHQLRTSRCSRLDSVIGIAALVAPLADRGCRVIRDVAVAAQPELQPGQCVGGGRRRRRHARKDPDRRRQHRLHHRRLAVGRNQDD